MLNDNEKYDQFLATLSEVPTLPAGMDDRILKHRKRGEVLRFWKPAVAAVLVLAGTFMMNRLTVEEVPTTASVTVQMDEYFSYLWEEDQEEDFFFESYENEML